MDCVGYIDLLKEKYQKYFDVESNIYIMGELIDLYAKFNVKNCRTFITKSDVVDSYENNEYCFIKKYSSIFSDDVSSFVDFLKKTHSKFVIPDTNHMSTYITGVMISQKTISDEIKKEAASFRYSRVHMFYIKGWSEIRLILVDLYNEAVIYNKPGKGVKRVYEFAPLK